MDLDYKKNRNTIVIYLHGRLESYHVDDIEEEIERLINSEASSHILLNLQDIDYVCSSGIGLFITVMNTLKRRGNNFGICNLNSPVKRIMELVEISTLLYIFNDEAEAVEFLNSGILKN
jgi:anti-anti-sigma factor